MKLRELFDRCDFDSMVPYLLRIDPNSATKIPWYKETYDILRRIDDKHRRLNIPDIDGIIRVTLYNGKIYVEYERKSLHYSNLGMQLDVADDVHIADAELAARCLWSLLRTGPMYADV